MKGFVMKMFKKLWVRIISIVAAAVLVLTFLFYGPLSFFRDTWITSAQMSFRTQWLAKLFYSQDTIDRVMGKNTVLSLGENTDPSLINISYNISGSEPIELIKIKTLGYRGYLLKVSDPSLVSLALTSKWKNDGSGEGRLILDMLKDYNAVAGINASGFKDKLGHSMGGALSGTIMAKGELLFIEGSDQYFENIIGMTEEGRLLLGNYTREELKTNGIVDAMSFFPALIVNGKTAQILGDGGWGLAPRTAIGQCADGTFLLLVIDGRQISSFGATMRDIQKIMLEHGAVNAVNLDGGASSVLAYKGKIVNYPCSSKTGRYLPNAFIVKNPEN